MGYEPFPAYRAKNLLGKEVWYYPNVFRYRSLKLIFLLHVEISRFHLVKFIYNTDGFLGFYRGFGYSLLSKVVCWYTTTKVDEVRN